MIAVLNSVLAPKAVLRIQWRQKRHEMVVVRCSSRGNEDGHIDDLMTDHGEQSVGESPSVSVLSIILGIIFILEASEGYSTRSCSRMPL